MLLHSTEDIIITILLMMITIFLVSSVKELYTNISKISNKNIEEHMVNISKPTRTATWGNDNQCGYKMSQTFTDIMKKNNINQSKKDDWLIYYPCSYNNIDQEIKNINPTNKDQRIFIIDNADQLSSKSNLWGNLIKKYGREEALKMAPPTYRLNYNLDMNLFKKEYDPDKIYIMKKNIQRQEGLKITNNKDEIINGKDLGYVVVQELLQDPYIINDRKTNMRFYILLVCQNNELAAYVHKNGFMYYTRMPFQKKTITDGPNITTGYIERWIYKVNPLSHDDFRNYLDAPDRKLNDAEQQLVNNNQQLSKVVFDRIYDLIKKMIVAIEHNVCTESHLKDYITFQLFGIDIATNDKLESVVIECNKGPSIECFDGDDCKVKQAVAGDIFKVLKVVDDKDNGFMQIL